MQTLVYEHNDKLYGTGDFEKLKEELEDDGFLDMHHVFEELMASCGIYTLLDLFNAIANCEISIEQISKDFEEIKDEAFRECLDYDVKSYVINVDD